VQILRYPLYPLKSRPPILRSELSNGFSEQAPQQSHQWLPIPLVTLGKRLRCLRHCLIARIEPQPVLMTWKRTFTGGPLAANSMHLKVLDIGCEVCHALVHFAFFGIRISLVTLSLYYELSNTGCHVIDLPTCSSECF
jgi:hypothetical protein